MDAHIRHGDVLLTRIDKMPSGAEKVEHDGQYILAYGEVTGHTHRITVEKPKVLDVRKLDGVTYIGLKEAAPLTHEEHKEVEVPPAFYRVDFEREHDYLAEETHRVID